MLIMAKATLKQLDLPWSPKGIAAFEANEAMSCDLADPGSDRHTVVAPAFLFYSQIWCARAFLREEGDPAVRQEDAISTSSSIS